MKLLSSILQAGRWLSVVMILLAAGSAEGYSQEVYDLTVDEFAELDFVRIEGFMAGLIKMEREDTDDADSPKETVEPSKDSFCSESNDAQRTDSCGEEEGGAGPLPCETGARDEPSGSLRDFSLQTSNSWPLNGRCEIRFALPHASWVRIDVFDLDGCRVWTLADDFFEKGQYLRYWDASGGSDLQMIEGIYLVSMRGYGLGDVRKVILVK